MSKRLVFAIPSLQIRHLQTIGGGHLTPEAFGHAARIAEAILRYGQQVSVTKFAPVVHGGTLGQHEAALVISARIHGPKKPVEENERFQAAFADYTAYVGRDSDRQVEADAIRRAGGTTAAAYTHASRLYCEAFTKVSNGLSMVSGLIGQAKCEAAVVATSDRYVEVGVPDDQRAKIPWGFGQGYLLCYEMNDLRVERARLINVAEFTR